MGFNYYLGDAKVVIGVFWKYEFKVLELKIMLIRCKGFLGRDV